jgi:hypothetical protein
MFTVVFALLAVEASSTQSPVTLASSGGLAKVAELPKHLQEKPEATLLQADTVEEDMKAVQHHAKMRGPPPAGFFGDFSQGESTFTYDGTLANRNENPMVEVLDGWTPQQSTPSSKSVKSAQWFEESKGGGYKSAWQTDYPAMPNSNVGNQVSNGAWFQGTGTVWQQDYKPAATLASSETIPASWFDSAVSQIDGFGRDKYPGYGQENPRWYLYWEERSVNTSLTCADPGCTANSSLSLPFSPDTEMAKNCKLSVLFHPTDFDDQYSGEKVDWVQLDGKQIMSNCHPMDHGGNATAFKPLLPCVEGLPIDVDGKSSISVAAKIPEVVDENKYNDNLLSGVSVITCMVTSKTQVNPQPKPETVSLTKDYCTFDYPLQCPTRGCAAQIAIPIGRYCLELMGGCTMNITVNQTDFDNKDGTVEALEYIKVDGTELVSNVLTDGTGQNPCKSAFDGTPVPTTDLVYKAVTSHALTWDPSKNSNGTIIVEGKISQYVDECASNGYLLDAIASITCSGKEPKYASSPALLAKESSVKSRKRFLASS